MDSIRPFWRESTSSEEMGQPPILPQTEHYTKVEDLQLEVEREGQLTEKKESTSVIR